MSPFDAEQNPTSNVPVSVRLLTPDAEGRPAEALSASSTGMFFTPPGP
jgi:hypothetical protein